MDIKINRNDEIRKLFHLCGIFPPNPEAQSNHGGNIRQIPIKGLPTIFLIVLLETHKIIKKEEKENISITQKSLSAV